MAKVARALRQDWPLPGLAAGIVLALAWIAWFDVNPYTDRPIGLFYPQEDAALRETLRADLAADAAPHATPFALALGALACWLGGILLGGPGRDRLAATLHVTTAVFVLLALGVAAWGLLQPLAWHGIGMFFAR